MGIMTKVIGVVVVLVLVFIAFLTLSPKEEQGNLVSNEPDEVATNLGLPSDDRFSWSFDSLGEDPETFAPKTSVRLHKGSKAYDVGTYSGSCTDVQDAELEDNQTMGALCWWAGFGDEVGVFRENGGHVLKHREIEEGTAESAGFIGQWKVLFTLN
jgi:hypothetical protein